MKAVILSAAVSLLIATAGGAQTIPRYWLSGLGSFLGLKPHATPTPPMIIPRLPLQAAPGIRVHAPLALPRDFKLFGPWPPLWIGVQEVAILGMRADHTVLSAFIGDHFQQAATLIDVPRGELLDLAVSPDQRHLAAIFNRGDHLEVALIDPGGISPPATIAEIPGAYQQASLAWIDPNTLAAGAGGSKPAEGNANSQSAGGAQHGLYLVSALKAYEPQALALECLGDIDPARLSWSPDRRLAIAPAANAAAWYLVDRLQARCTVLRLGQIVPVNLLQWSADSRRFLFTVVPKATPEPFAMGVAEYDVPAGVATVLATPAGAAVYLGKRGEAVLGSRTITALSLRVNPQVLAAAEIGWFTSTHAQLKIVPLGVRVQGGALLEASMIYSDQNDLVAINLRAPGGSGDFPALLWLAASLRNGGVLAYGETHGFLSASWSPDGGKIAVIGGRLDAPAAAVFDAPIQ